ncbi:MAG TPA: hypothetical protein VNH45_14260 [Gaiellaceae bacterium]|jgi:hypothetical protein|nr:hypothetical protein [Gaiellaceae bacterium]
MRVRRLLPLLAVVAAGAVRISTLFSASAIVTPDTFDYARQSRLSVLDPAFWGSQHPPLLSLLWKPLPGLVTSVDPVTLGDVGPALFLNAFVGAACWGILALTVASLAESSRVRWLALLGILALSLAPEVSGWDGAALSESLALSLTALVLALAIRYVREPSHGSAAALAAALVAFALVRDSDVPLAVLGLAPVLIVTRGRRSIVLAALVGSIGLSLWGQNAGERSALPTRNAIANEVNRHGEAPWFRAHGLPWRSDVPALLGERPQSTFLDDPRTADLQRWLERDGRSAWLAYLASHPARSLSLAHNLTGVADPPRPLLEQYWSTGRSPLSFFPRGVLLAILASFGVVGAALVARTKESLLLTSWLAATLPVALLMWVLDAVEFDRHAVVLPVVLRIVVIALGALTLDAIFAAVAQRRSYAAQIIPKYVGASYERSSPAKPSPTAP